MTPSEHRPNHQPLVAPGGIECLWRDMTVIVSADVTLDAVQRKLAEQDQWLPIDGDPKATVGQLVSINSTGPLRLGYGAWRDLLLGAQFLDGRDDLITAGGRTVKNVAGYDLTKFMVGQRGVFGRLVTVTTRTYRRPDVAVRLRIRRFVEVEAIRALGLDHVRTTNLELACCSPPSANAASLAPKLRLLAEASGLDDVQLT